MKSTLSLLLSFAALTLAAPAAALQTNVLYDVRVGGADAGQISFDLDAEGPRGICRYSVEWDSNGPLPLSGGGFVDERKVHGAASCVGNALKSFTTIVTNDTIVPFIGFDQKSQANRVFSLVLGESDFGELFGIIQWGASSASTLFPLELEARP